MISVFFVPGMFGSSIEYILRSFSNNFSDPIPSRTEIIGLQADGSMHSFQKEWHPGSLLDYNQDMDVEIATPIYPFKEAKFLQILEAHPIQKPGDISILLYADSLRSAELNMLFQYHKIAFGAKIQFGLDIFCGDNTHNIINWNKEYTHWDQMQLWELREWISLFYAPWVQEWINSQYEVPKNFLKISNTDMLFHTKDTIKRIFNFCNETITGDIDSFIKEWSEKQQYIVDEFTLLDDICNNTINNITFSWNQINIIAESILQQRFRALGFEIRCDGLNNFPTESKALYNLLERC